MKSKREIGTQLEAYVADKLSQVLQDPSIRPTRGSGGSVELGDVYNKKFIIECKCWDKKDIHISLDVWKKLLAEVPVGSVRIPMYVFEHRQTGKKFAMMEFDDLCDVINKDIS